MLINDRISRLIELLDMTPNGFAESIGVSGTVIFNIIKGRRNKPSYDLLEKIFYSFEDVNPNWLMKGEGTVLTRVQDDRKVLPLLHEDTGLYRRKMRLEEIIDRIGTDYDINKRTLKMVKKELDGVLEENVRYRVKIVQLQEGYDKVVGILKARLNLEI